MAGNVLLFFRRRFPWLTKRGGRGISVLIPAAKSAAAIQADTLTTIAQNRYCGITLVRRRKEECKKNGYKYRRDDAINAAADSVGLGRDALRNWMNRSRRDS